jgi:hypothetical protein
VATGMREPRASLEGQPKDSGTHQNHVQPAFSLSYKRTLLFQNFRIEECVVGRSWHGSGVVRQLSSTAVQGPKEARLAAPT